MLLTRMRFAELSAQLCDLGSQRVESAGELFRDGTEGEERSLQFGTPVFDQLEICGCHAGGGKQLLCLGGICSSYQPVTSKPARPKQTASKICQALRRYLRSFSTRVVRRMPRSRAASATVPSASSSALRMSPTSIADR